MHAHMSPAHEYVTVLFLFLHMDATQDSRLGGQERGGPLSVRVCVRVCVCELPPQHATPLDQELQLPDLPYITQPPRPPPPSPPPPRPPLP